MKITETPVSCALCHRPIDPGDGPSSRESAAIVASIERNSLLARLHDLDVLEATLKAEKKTKHLIERRELVSRVEVLTLFIRERAPFFAR